MSLAGGCRGFQPNVFNATRCQNCFKVEKLHANVYYNCAKMGGRKIVACSFLYVAPTSLDFSIPSHSTKKWQRRYFTLYSDGGLEVRIDSNIDTVPQLKMDMKRCIRVCAADPITNHQHSLLIAFRNNQYVDFYATNEQKSNDCCEHPVVCYVKADSNDEIRCWQNVLQVFARTLIQATPSRQSPSPLIEQTEVSQSRCESAMSNVEESTFLAEQEDYAENTYSIVEDDIKIDEVKEASEEDQTNFQLPIKTQMSVPFQIDTSNMHTLRKGWLMLRGKNDNEWHKHWVVLAGLNLKLYNDVWADDNAQPLLNIDLSECENIYPAATKNYGIEIKCKRARYILSAMTPGIRDSWISALQQNLHNPSPTYSSTMDAHSQADSADILSITRRKKVFAYVAPESHHSNSIMDGFSTSTENDDGDSSVRPTIDIPDSNVVLAPQTDSASLASALMPTVSRGAPTSALPNHQRRRSNRQLSLSPSMRRSPVNRLKERRRGLDQRNAQRVPAEQLISPSSIGSRRTSHRQLSAQDGEPSASTLQQQVQKLQNQLSYTKSRLSELANENDSLRTLFSSQDINHLRRCLHAAEENVIRQQNEMDVILQKQFESPAATTSNSSMLREVDSQNSDHFPIEISQLLVGLLKVQVGALSKVLHSSSHSATSFIYLRQYVDSLIRTVAGLDENTPQSIILIQDAFNDVIAAFENLSSILKSTGIGSANTEAESANVDTLKSEIRDLELEIEHIQNAHGQEIQTQKADFERQLQALRERLTAEESARRKLQEELQKLHTTGYSNHESEIADLRQQFEEHLQKLQQEHDQELEDEKQATKIALDVVQRAHTEELQKLKANNPIKKECKCQTDCSVRKTESPRQKEVVELMSAELSNLSTLYSAKCLENTQLDEKIKNLMEKEKQKNDLEVENGKLKRDLQQKDGLYEQLRKRLDYLELKLKDSNNTRSEYPPSALKTEPVDPAVRFRMQPKNSGPASRKASSNRRNDIRYHSNPLIPYSASADHGDIPFSAYYERHYETDKKIIPVRERCKFFEKSFECGPF